MAIPKLEDPHKILAPATRREILEFARKATASPDMEERTQRGGLGFRGSDVILERGVAYLGLYNPGSVTLSTMKKMAMDPQVALTLAAALAPMRTAPWSVKAESHEIKALVEEALVTPHAKTFLDQHGNAVRFGYQVSELLWDRGEVEWDWADDEAGEQKTSRRSLFLVKDLKDLDPADFQFVADAMGHVVGITQRGTYPDSADVVEMAKLLHLVNEAMWGNPHGVARLSRVYPTWYWETVLYLLANQYWERRAVPSHVLFADPADAPKDPDTGQRSTNALTSIAAAYSRNLKSQSVVALWSKFHPDGKERLWDLKVLEEDPRGEQFIAYLQHLDTKIARGLLVPERAFTGNDATGSYGQSKAQKGVAEIMANTLLDDVAKAWNEQVLPRWLAANGITERVRVVHGGVAEDTSELYAMVLEALFKAEDAIVRGENVSDVSGLLVSMVDGLRLLERCGVPTLEKAETGAARDKGGDRGPIVVQGTEPEADPSPSPNGKEGQDPTKPEPKAQASMYPLPATEGPSPYPAGVLYRDAKGLWAVNEVGLGVAEYPTMEDVKRWEDGGPLASSSLKWENDGEFWRARVRPAGEFWTETLRTERWGSSVRMKIGLLMPEVLPGLDLSTWRPRFTRVDVDEEQVTEDTNAPEVARLTMEDWRLEWDSWLRDAEGEVDRLAAPMKEDLETRHNAAKAVVLLLLLMSRKQAADGTPVPGQDHLRDFVYDKNGNLLKPRKVAAALPALQAAAATLPGGGLRLAGGNSVLLTKALKGLRSLVGAKALRKGVRGVRTAVGGMMQKATQHFQRGARKGGYGIRDDWRRRVREGWPPVPPAPPEERPELPPGPLPVPPPARVPVPLPPPPPARTPEQKEMDERGEDSWEDNENGIRNNIDNIAAREMAWLSDMLRNAFATRRVLDAIGSLEPEEEGEWLQGLAAVTPAAEFAALGEPMLAMFSPTCRKAGETEADCVARKIPEIYRERTAKGKGKEQAQKEAVGAAHGMCRKACSEDAAAGDGGDRKNFGIVQDAIDWTLNRRNTDLTTEAHLRGAYRAAMLIHGRFNGLRYWIGLHPPAMGDAEETGPRGGVPSCRDLDGKVGTEEWWNRQGERTRAPMPMEMFGLGWGCRILFFPVPSATVIRDRVEVGS